MAILTTADVADLRTEFTDAQVDHSLVLYRNDGTGTYPALPAQNVQVMYANRMPQLDSQPGIVQTLSGLSFYREAPFDVKVGDAFMLDGHTGGTIRRVLIDPVLGVIIAEADLDTGR